MATTDFVVKNGLVVNENAVILEATDASSKDTGALVVEGGVGIEKKLYVGTDLAVGSNSTLSGDLAVNGGDLTTSATTFNLVNATATTVNFAGAATDVQIGAATGTTNINNNLDVDGDVNIDGGDLTVSTTTFNLANANATTINFGGAATTLEIGAATGTTNINNNLDVDGDVNIDGGDLTVSTTTFNIANTTATTVNAFGEAATFNIADDVTAAQTVNFATGATANTITKTVNIGTGGVAGSTTNINLGSASGGTVTANSIIKSGVGTSNRGIDFAVNDNYAGFRVIHNPTASGGNADGLYLGYQNGNSGATRLFGGGSGTVSATINSHATAATSSTTGSVVINGGLGINNSVFSDGLVSINRQAAINTTTPGFAQYGLHFQGQTTADYATGITFNGGSGTTNAQAGIYVQGSGSYGTKMYFGTTDDYGTGSKTRLTIQHNGQITMPANIASTTTGTGTLVVTGGVGVSGAIYAGSIISTSNQIQSTIATGTSPLSVSSTTLVTNLNANYVEGQSLSNLDTRYVNVTGDTMTGDLTFSDDGEGVVWSRNTDNASIKFYNTGDGDANSRLEFNIGDNGNEYFIFTDTTGGTRTELLKILPNGTGTTAITFKGNTVWHAGNDGAGSGLDADTLDGLHASSFLTAESDTLASVTGRGFITRASAGTFATNTQGTPGLEIYGAGTTNPAYMTFHRPGQYAVRFGLDGSDLYVGGWSMGNVAYKIWHQGNDGAGSGLDADLLDGSDWATTTKTVYGTFIGTIPNTSGGGDNNAPFRFSTDYSGWVSLLAGTAGNADGWGTFWAGNDSATYRYFDTVNPNEYVFVGAGAVKASIDLDNGQSYFGTSVRSPIFYDSDSTSYYGDFASQSSFNTAITNGFSSRDYARQVIPQGASYTTSTSSVTGAIKIRMPTSSRLRYPMLSFTTHIYSYSTGISYTYRIGGHYSSTQWYNVFAICLTDSGPKLNVRFGYDGDYICVWIGETTTNWSYPQVFVTDFQNGYSSIDNSWLTDWNISFQTTFNTVTNGPYSPSYPITTSNSSRSNWSSNGTIAAVVGQLAWKNYGNSHTIFDASAGTSPDGTSVNNTNAAIAWSGTYPTLMGWNGASTYGVRVDSARVADNGGVTSVSATSPIAVNQTTGAVTVSHANSGVTAGTYNNVTVNATGHVTGGSNVGYLTSESDTLATVTNRGNTATGNIAVPSGEGTGYCFWGNGSSYKISMGSTASLYQYGPVIDYSIKMQMDSGSTGRGFTWGRDGAKPIAALNSTSGNMQIAGSFSALSKSFLIDHPTKEGMKLQYACLEGPENGVYVRGKLEGDTVIELPDYWLGLVHSDSITVNLTPCGSGQQLYVDRIEDNCVHVVNETGKPIKCFYTVYGERKDVDKLEVEFYE